MVKKHSKLRQITLVLSVFVLMFMIVFLVGKSFGFFQYAKKGDVVNVITIKGLSVNIDNSTDSALNLTNAYPMYDSDGVLTDPFVFTINNNSSKAVSYTLSLLNDTSKQETCFVDQAETTPCTLLPYQYIKYSYSINDGTYSIPANLTSSGAIYSEMLNANASTKISLKIWIDSSAPNSIQGNVFFGMLVLSGEQSVFNNLPPEITVGDSYVIAREANSGETISCVSNIDGSVSNTSTLTVGSHTIMCTIVTSTRNDVFSKTLVVNPIDNS